MTHHHHLNSQVTVHKDLYNVCKGADTTIPVCAVSCMCVQNTTTDSISKVCWAVYPLWGQTIEVCEEH
jgi:hypothetical protein